MNIDRYKPQIGIMILIILIFLGIFGITGARFGIGIGVCLVLPFYIILDRLKDLDMTHVEKVVFSLFLSIGLFSSLVYIFARLIGGSVRIGMILSFIVLIGIGIALKRLNSPKHEE